MLTPLHLCPLSKKNYDDYEKEPCRDTRPCFVSIPWGYLFKTTDWPMFFSSILYKVPWNLLLWDNLRRNTLKGTKSPFFWSPSLLYQSPFPRPDYQLLFGKWACAPSAREDRLDMRERRKSSLSLPPPLGYSSPYKLINQTLVSAALVEGKHYSHVGQCRSSATRFAGCYSPSVIQSKLGYKMRIISMH